MHTVDAFAGDIVNDYGGSAAIGYGAGHYDSWMGAHPPRVAIGLAWDCQLVDELPMEPHDVPIHAVITPTRMYGPF